MIVAAAMIIFPQDGVQALTSLRRTSWGLKSRLIYQSKINVRNTYFDVVNAPMMIPKRHMGKYTNLGRHFSQS